ncbi:hypothetical protein Barb6_02706 [Bacteroidales bacterium Barb6]|nr:hypothetical protein Barb6_02706 [Bacteroidales bacterium Barb6]
MFLVQRQPVGGGYGHLFRSPQNGGTKRTVVVEIAHDTAGNAVKLCLTGNGEILVDTVGGSQQVGLPVIRRVVNHCAGTSSRPVKDKQHNAPPCGFNLFIAGRTGKRLHAEVLRRIVAFGFISAQTAVGMVYLAHGQPSRKRGICRLLIFNHQLLAPHGGHGKYPQFRIVQMIECPKYMRPLLII